MTVVVKNILYVRNRVYLLESVSTDMDPQECSLGLAGGAVFLASTNRNEWTGMKTNGDGFVLNGRMARYTNIIELRIN